MTESSARAALGLLSVRRPSVSRADGFTLIELLMAVTILGIAFTVLIGGMFTYVRGSAVHQAQANVDLYATQYAESIANAGYAATCPATYAATGYSPPAGYTVSNGVAFWNEATSSFGPACAAGDGRLQRVRAVVTEAAGGYVVTVDVVKRAP